MFFFSNLKSISSTSHDLFDGVLGQTYKCKYQTEKFQFDHAQEEFFRVDNLFATSGSFDSSAPCDDVILHKQSTKMIGGSMDQTI